MRIGKTAKRGKHER